MEEQKDLVEMTKRRLTRLYGVQKLEKIAIGTIIRSINPHAALNLRNHLAKYFSYNMCDKIFQRLLVEMKKNPEINKFQYLLKIPCLLTANTKYLDLDAFLLECKSHYYPEECPTVDCQEMDVVLWVINIVKYQATIIEHIVFNSRNIDLQNAQHLTLLDFLADLKNLKILEMKRVFIEFRHVVKLCKNLPQLQILDICGFAESRLEVTDEEIRQSLGNVRLLMGSSEGEDRAIQQQFPLLNFAEEFGDEVKTTFRSVKYRHFQVTEKGNPGQRKYFYCGSYWFESPDMDIHEKYPDVTYLKINCYRAWMNTPDRLELPKFSKIKTLIMRGSRCDALFTKILRFYGPGLQTLCLGACFNREDVDMKILDLSPNLESIQLMFIDFGETSMQLKNFPFLKDLYLEVSGYPKGKFLPKMLSSPRLQKLYLLLGVYYKEDLDELNTMVTEGLILQELETLTIDTCGGNMAMDTDAFKELLVFLEKVSAFLPKLKDIKFIFDCEDYVDVAKRLKNGQDYHTNEIKAMIVSNKTLVPIIESFGKLRR